MECDQCGARRPRSGPCPECGAPAPGTYSSMRQWRDQTRTGQGPAVGGGRGSGANWKNSASSSRMRNPRNGWDEGGYEEEPPMRSSAANRRRPNYDEVDLEQALVPSHGDMLPMDPNAMSMGAGLPALPGIPQTDEEERAIGIRRPVYIPATSEKRKKKLGTWRVLSGVVSVMLICVASCGVAALFGHSQLSQFLKGASKIIVAPPAYSTAGVPVTPVATPGAQHKYVTNIITAKGVSTDLAAIDQTSHFTAGSQVDVICLVRGITKGQKHTISIHWFYDGTDMQLPIVNGKTSEAVTSDQFVYFAMQYQAAGLGMAKIFFDLPSTDNGNQANDPYLAGQILFAIDPANGASATPTQVPTATPKATPKPTATATAKTT